MPDHLRLPSGLTCGVPHPDAPKLRCQQQRGHAGDSHMNGMVTWRAEVPKQTERAVVLPHPMTPARAAFDVADAASAALHHELQSHVETDDELYKAVVAWDEARSTLGRLIKRRINGG